MISRARAFLSFVAMVDHLALVGPLVRWNPRERLQVLA
jgi:hypothetical protein